MAATGSAPMKAAIPRNDRVVHPISTDRRNDMATQPTDPVTLPIDNPVPAPTDPIIPSPADPGASDVQPEQPTQPEPDTPLSVQ